MLSQPMISSTARSCGGTSSSRPAAAPFPAVSRTMAQPGQVAVHHAGQVDMYFPLVPGDVIEHADQRGVAGFVDLPGHGQAGRAAAPGD
jgi:hypothetical protein